MSIYSSPAGEAAFMALYDKYLQQLSLPCESREVETRYGKTHLLVLGPHDAPPLIFLQGGNSLGVYMLQWFLPLAQHYRIYAPDMIGHPGRSAQTRLSPTDESYAIWLCDVMDGLHLPQARVLGISYGGGVLGRLAAYAPERIEKAVFIVPAGFVTGSSWRMLSEILLPLGLYLMTGQRRWAAAVARAIDPALHEEMVEQIEASFRHVKMETRFPRLVSGEELSRFRAPTLVLAAENDIFFPGARVIQRARELFSNLTVALVPGAAHFIVSEDALRINQRVLEFL